MRPSLAKKEQEYLCSRARGSNSTVLITGIKRILHDRPPHQDSGSSSSVLLIERGRATCLGEPSVCVPSLSDEADLVRVELKDGHVTPGLVAFGNTLGIQSISSETATGDGSAGSTGNALDAPKSLHFAKYGVHLHDRAFTRARIGGITKTVTAPLGGGILQGVSVGLRVTEDASILGNGIWKDNVALHLTIGQSARGKLLL